MEEIFMRNQLMTQLNNITKLEKYQQEKVMIILLVVYWIFLILKKKYRLIAAYLSKQKAFDADSGTIQQIIFTGKTDNTIRVIIILNNQKKQY